MSYSPTREIALMHLKCKHHKRLLANRLNDLKRYKVKHPSETKYVNNALKQCYEELFELLAMLEVSMK